MLFKEKEDDIDLFSEMQLKKKKEKKKKFLL